MVKINKKIEYALMALKHMHDKVDQEDLTSAREICDRYQTPFDTTAKVMQSMNLAGILRSVKGVKGGYTLAKKLDQITFQEICLIIEGKTSYIGCHPADGGRCAMYDICNIHDPLELLEAKINHYLEGLTLKDLFQTKLHEVEGCGR